MRSVIGVGPVIFAVAGFLTVMVATGSSVSAQVPSGSLGGYGAASGYSNSSMGGSGAMVIPYGGMTEGFMPSRTGGGNSLSYRSRPTATMGSNRTSFSLSPTSGGMGQRFGTGSRMSTPFGPASGLNLGGAMGRRNPGFGGMGVMPPSIGYPFRQPPSLVPTSAPGAGMSM